MRYDWDSLTAAHVDAACRVLVGRATGARQQARGIFVVYEGGRLPAKEVLRLAYLLAHNLELDTPMQFASGEGTVRRFHKLGFRTERVRQGGIQGGAGFGTGGR